MHVGRQVLILGLVLGFRIATPCLGEASEPKIAVHLGSVVSKGICTTVPMVPCNLGDSTIVVAGDVGTGYQLYIYVVDADSVAGVAGVTFGISYGENLSVSDWTRCADLEFPGGAVGVAWPQSGSGNLVTWSSQTNCQSEAAAGDIDGGVTALVGAFYVYAYSQEIFEVTPRQYVADPDLNVADCSAHEISLLYPDHVGSVGFGGVSGFDPCLDAGSGEDFAGGNDPPEPPGDTWSSKIDPVAMEFDWPVSIRLGVDQAIVCENQMYLDGDVVQFNYDPEGGVLLCNQAVWQSLASQGEHTESSTIGSSPEARWTYELLRRIELAEGVSKEDRVRNAFASMPTDLLDLSFPPELGATQVTLMFRRTGSVGFIPLENPSTSASPEMEARRLVMSLQRGLSGGVAYTAVRYGGRYYVRGGSLAREVVGVLRLARDGGLDGDGLALAKRHGIDDVVQAIQSRMSK